MDIIVKLFSLDGPGIIVCKIHDDGLLEFNLKTTDPDDTELRAFLRNR